MIAADPVSELQPSIYQKIKENRERAAEAAASADKATDDHARNSFLMLAAGWTALAVSLERELLRSNPATPDSKSGH